MIMTSVHVLSKTANDLIDRLGKCHLLFKSKGVVHKIHDIPKSCTIECMIDILESDIP